MYSSSATVCFIIGVFLASFATASPYSQILSRDSGSIAPNLPIKSPPNGFTLDWTPSPKMDLIPVPGQLVPMNATFLPPQVSSSSLPGPGPYTLLMVDSSVNTTTPTSTTLHWLQPNLYINSKANASSELLSNRSAPIDNYLSPQPITCTQPHYYTVMLFSQDPAWTLPKQFSNFVAPENPGQYYQSLWDTLGNDITTGNNSGASQFVTGLLGSSGPPGGPTRYSFPFADFIANSGLGELVASTYFAESLPDLYKSTILTAEKCPGYTNSTDGGSGGTSPKSTPTPSASGAMTTGRGPSSSSSSTTRTPGIASATPIYTGGAVANAINAGTKGPLVAAAGLIFGVLL